MRRRSGRRTNVLLLWTDQQRPDTIGAYGNTQIRTPHLDRLAAQGILFEQAYCTQPVCSPSRASVLTGLFPHTHGVRQCNQVLSEAVPTVAELLRAQGYVGGYVGKWHLGHELRPQRGFQDFWISTEDMYTHFHATTSGRSSYHQFLMARGYLPRDNGPLGAVFSRDTAARLPEEVSKPACQAAEAMRFLEHYRDHPFMLSVNFLEPHYPYFGPWDGMYAGNEMTLPETWYREMETTVPKHYRLRRRLYAERNHYVETNDERGWKELKARYWGLCSLVDKYAGQVLQRLEELGLAEDTIVVYTSDHGEQLGEHRLLTKTVQYEGSVRVPLIMRVPEVVRARHGDRTRLEPRRMTTPVSLVDLTPTLLDLLGYQIPRHMQGVSLRPLLAEGDRDPEEAEVFIEWNEWDGIRPVYEQVPETPPASVDARTIRRGRWKLNVHVTNEAELYDLAADPDEAHNALRDPGAGPVVRTLYARLREWQVQTGDSLALPDPSVCRPLSMAGPPGFGAH